MRWYNWNTVVEVAWIEVVSTKAVRYVYVDLIKNAKIVVKQMNVMQSDIE